MRGFSTAVRLLAVIAAAAVPALAAELCPAGVGCIEFDLRTNQQSRVYGGFTLAALTGSRTVALLNLSGAVVHSWPVEAVRARLLPNCSILVLHGKELNLSKQARREKLALVAEYDWSGRQVWEYRAPHPAHHDVTRLANGNTIFPYRYSLKYVLPEGVGRAGPRRRKVRTDVLLEVSLEGRIVWEWRAHDHLDIRSCGKRRCNFPLEAERWIEQQRDWTHINTVQPLPDNKWWRQGDVRFRPGNVMVLPRNWSQVLLIDRSSGAVVWKYSGVYKDGLLFPHESHMIAEGLPGAGNVLIFDNGGRVREQSIALEINPFTQEIVWLYEDGPRFYSRSGAALQRLPNGNTLISEDVRGRIFEVTPAKEIVWDLKASRYVSRAKRYDPEYCPLFKELQLH